jgi:predicted 2-oxoglutarate/Fe(II)-dependent dioxygenase YbiX
MKVIKHSDEIITVEDFWNNSKCEEYILASEKIGYGPALINTQFGQQRVNHIRNNERVIHDNLDLANSIWQDLKSIAPKQFGNHESIGLNERFRFYKYQIGQQFKKHRDQSFIRNQHEASYFTFMIYLNDNFEGGSTSFEDLKITPKQGMALIFYHPILHSGGAVTKGIKYILRTDIMFKLNH